VVQISSGDRHSMALTKGGQVFAWGDHTFGQLGFGKLPVDKVYTPQVSSRSVQPNKRFYVDKRCTHSVEQKREVTPPIVFPFECKL
jgi:alpha-tubulin suppressor-like RCC1 family protein